MAKELTKELTKDMFENIIVMFVSEPGAMGPNTMEFMNASGEIINVAYTVDNTYETLREVFPLLKECRWDGPMANEKDSIGGIKIGGGEFSTRVPNGWSHVYLDVGNHLAIKDEYYEKAMKILSNYQNIDITFEWGRLLIEGGFIDNCL
jgi:hypothetical protein